MALSQLSVDLTRSSFFTFFEKKVKPKNLNFQQTSLFIKVRLFTSWEKWIHACTGM